MGKAKQHVFLDVGIEECLRSTPPQEMHAGAGTKLVITIGPSVRAPAPGRRLVALGCCVPGTARPRSGRPLCQVQHMHPPAQICCVLSSREAYTRLREGCWRAVGVAPSVSAAPQPGHAHAGHLCQAERARAEHMPRPLLTTLPVHVPPHPALPAQCQDVGTLARLLQAGVACARVDLSWGTKEYHARSLANLAEAMHQTRRLCRQAGAAQRATPSRWTALSWRRQFSPAPSYVPKASCGQAGAVWARAHADPPSPHRSLSAPPHPHPFTLASFDPVPLSVFAACGWTPPGARWWCGAPWSTTPRAGPARWTTR